MQSIHVTGAARRETASPARGARSQKHVHNQLEQIGALLASELSELAPSLSPEQFKDAWRRSVNSVTMTGGVELALRFVHTCK